MNSSIMGETITCKYSCNECGINEQAVEVPIRGKSQDIVDWVSLTVGYALKADHEYRSPDCQPETLTKVIIPVPAGSSILGRPVEH